MFKIVIHMLNRKLMKKFLVTALKKDFVLVRLLTIKNTSGKNLMTSHLQLSRKGCHYNVISEKAEAFIYPYLSILVG